MDRVIKAARTSGSLNLSNRSLKEVPDEVYKSLDAVGEGENWWEALLTAVELQKLILARNDIESLKEDIRNLPLLAVLNISHNKLSHLPAAIGELQSLKSLDVSFNSILKIPEEVGSATALVKFDCSNNQLKDLPSAIGKCLDLSDLKASNDFITSLPEDLPNCSKLTKFDVEGNKLTALPENLIASWTLLSELNAPRNSLNGIPQNIGSLSCLIRLDLHQNRISSIPSSIMGCTSLAEFYMGNNVLVSLPAEIGGLNQLGTFDLHSNQLKEYPVEGCKLRLSVLDLSNNSLSGLPPEIGLMTTLRKLLLNGNPLRTLRSSLVTGPTPALLKFLQSRLPADEDSVASSDKKEVIISKVARLSLTSKELSLGGLSLTAVPAEVWESSEITKVDLSRNSIEVLPDELSSCSSLEVSRQSHSMQAFELRFESTKLLDHIICVLKESAITLCSFGYQGKSDAILSCLKLDNNPIGQIPPDGFQAASKLQILDLSGNAGSLSKFWIEEAKLF